MQLGTAPIAWGVCEMDDWGERLPIELVLGDMARLGYEGTELGPFGYLPTDSTELRNLLSRHGLIVMAAFCPVTLHRSGDDSQALTDARRIAELLGEVGGEFLVVADAGNPERLSLAGRVAQSPVAPSFDQDEWRRFADGLHEVAHVAAASDVRTVFHPEAGSYVETPEEIDQVLALTQPDLIGLCLDTGHVTYGGGDSTRLIQRFPDRVWHVHAKDVDPLVLSRVRTQDLDYFAATAQGIFVPVGRGCVDFGGVLSELQIGEYAGWVIVEQDIRLGPSFAAQDPRANASFSLNTLRRLGV